MELIDFVQRHPVLIPMMKPHDINRQGVPKGLKKVPALLQDNGILIVGLEVLRWMENMVPVSFDGNPTSQGYSFSEPFDGIGDSFALDSYGVQLAPPMTKELEEKIAYDVGKKFKEVLT
jgi:hypothetical protein